MNRIDELINKYEITAGFNPQKGEVLRFRTGVSNEIREEIKSMKPEILAELKRRKSERQSKIDAIEGLKEIEHARYLIAEWRRKNNASIDRGDSVYVPRPKVDIAALEAQYPRAVAYLFAEGYSYAANFRKAAAGRRALEKIINGEDHEKVISDMEAEWSEYTHQHRFD